ncbi:MAG: hypothetical protein IPJ61_20710 [Tessaracoccus sp.]|uniref:hypothetical protein n=1 Tax=Tessaracoccus sp. TaxID=1971211 RepID=UPI001EBEC26E|nr:hypothetical protein [Tessaracoccus sp.]MBK7823411.1 hypothetical protein [Tessaracoccus sp.]
MPDDNATSDQTPPMQSAAPAPQPAPAITQADLDRAVAAAAQKAHDAAWAESRRLRDAASKPPAAPAPQPRTDTTEPQAHADPLAILKLRDDFDDATADLQLASPQRRFLREQVMATRPPDVAAFVRGFVDVWGSKPAAPAATTTNVTNPAPASPAHPATAMLGTTPPVTVTSDTPLTSLGKTDLDAAIRRLGPHEFSKRWMSELASSGKRIPIR